MKDAVIQIRDDLQMSWLLKESRAAAGFNEPEPSITFRQLVPPHREYTITIERPIEEMAKPELQELLRAARRSHPRGVLREKPSFLRFMFDDPGKQWSVAACEEDESATIRSNVSARSGLAFLCEDGRRRFVQLDRHRPLSGDTDELTSAIRPRAEGEGRNGKDRKEPDSLRSRSGRSCGGTGAPQLDAAPVAPLTRPNAG